MWHKRSGRKAKKQSRPLLRIWYLVASSSATSSANSRKIAAFRPFQYASTRANHRTYVRVCETPESRRLSRSPDDRRQYLGPTLFVEPKGRLLSTQIGAIR